MSHRFHGKNAELHWNDLFMLLAIVVALAAAAWCLTRVARRERHRRTNSPRGLFQELCRGHQLDRQSRNLLGWLVKHHDLSQPASLFLDPTRFDPSQLPALLPAQAERLAKLREQLFSEEVVEPTVAAEATTAKAMTAEPIASDAISADAAIQ